MVYFLCIINRTMKLCVPIFIVINLIWGISKSEDLFIASFQASQNWSTDEWMEYTKPIPPIKEFTTCFWSKIKYFPADYVIVWQYCGVQSQVTKSMKCVQFYLRPNVETASRHVDLYGWLGTQEVVIYSIPYKHRTWNHFCWSFSSINGGSMFFHNGKLVGNKSISTSRGEFFTIQGDQAYEDSAFIIGQEQDWIRGRYEASQVYSGEITELNMWSDMLTQNKISLMASCRSFEKGNIVAWERNNFRIHKVADQGVTKNYNLMCQPIKKHIIFPKAVTLKDAEILCHVHGGRIATPTSEEENDQMIEIVKKHKEKCLDLSNPLQQKRSLWLGMKQINNTFYKMNFNTIIGTPTYTRWDQYTPFYPNLGCAFMQEDGYWGFRDKDTCNKLELCTVCVFDEIPIFTLKGLHKNITGFDMNYFMVTNATNQIEYYDGATLSRLRASARKWSVGTDSVTIERPISTHPLGRSSWISVDSDVHNPKTNRMILTLSVCKFGEDFTCNSGQCVPIRSRCDDVVNCEDGSDETDCMLLKYPESYQASRPPKPNINASSVLSIITQFRIVSFDRIDTVNMIIGITAELSLTWKDSRLIFTNLHDGKNGIPNEIVKQLWLPVQRIIHENAIIGSMHKDSSIQAGVMLSPYTNRIRQDLANHMEDNTFKGSECPLLIKERFKVEYNCNFNLKKFPFDRQRCVLLMKMKIHLSSRLSLAGDSFAPWIYDGSSTVYEFEINKIDHETINTYNETKFLIYIDFSRNYMNHMISTFFPTFLLWVLAYSTLFIKIEDFTDRIMVTVTALLVLVSFLASVRQELPKTSYFKYMDLWFLWYVSSIFMITIYHIFLDMVDDGKEHQNSIGALSRIQIEPIDKPSSEKVKYGDKESSTSIRKNYINKWALAVFPTFTMIFNAIYFSFTT